MPETNPASAMKDSELDQLLKVTDANTPTHAGFQREVWLRIEAAEAASWKPRVRLFIERFFSSLALPPVAVTTCAAMVAVGVWIGFVSASSTSQGQSEMAYIQAISPFAQTHR